MKQKANLLLLYQKALLQMNRLLELAQQDAWETIFTDQAGYLSTIAAIQDAAQHGDAPLSAATENEIRAVLQQLVSYEHAFQQLAVQKKQAIAELTINSIKHKKEIRQYHTVDLLRP